MAATTTTPSQVRPRREREEELLVWPDLVFVEFICAVLFTFTFTVISALINAPLINRANPDETPNPSKAPWYFLNLQELLLHMNPALAGVVVPTVFLIVLAAVPYLDRSKEGQGVWFGTPNAVRITIFSGVFAFIGTMLLILLDAGKHAQLYEIRWNLWWVLIIVLVIEVGLAVTAGLAWFGLRQQRPPNESAGGREQAAAAGFIVGLLLLIITVPSMLVVNETDWRDETVKDAFVWPTGEDRPDWLPDVGVVTAGWDLIFSRDFRSIQTSWSWSIDFFGMEGPTGTDGRLQWPEDFSRIPLPVVNGTWWPKWGNDHGEPPPQWYQDLPDWLTGLYPYDLNVNFPAILVEIIIPTILMVGLPVLLIYILWRINWVNTRRDVMISLFSGFIVAYWVMTIIGAAFRGAGQELVWPWDVPRIDG